MSSIRIKITRKSSIILESQQPDSLSRIQALEDQSQFVSKIDLETVYNEKPSFTRALYNIECKEGFAAHLEATLTPVNDPNLKVEWFINGVPVITGHRFKITHEFGYVALDILYIYIEDSGTFMCKASNKAGEAITTCSVKVTGKRGIETDTFHEDSLHKISQLEMVHIESREIPAPEKVKPTFTTTLCSLENLRENDSAHIEATLIPINDPKLVIEWFINGVPLRKAHRFRTTHDFGYVALDILHVYAEDSGTYMCKATNEMGEAATTCVIKVQSRKSIYYETHHPEGLEKIQQLEYQPPRQDIDEIILTHAPQFTTQPTDVELTENELAHFECRLIPVGDPNLKVEWFHNGMVLISGTRVKTISDFGFVVLEITGCYPRDSGVYVCKATNKHGEASVSCTLKVTSKLSVILEPQLPGEFGSGTESIKRLEAMLNMTHEAAAEKDRSQPPKFITQIQDLLEKAEGNSAHFECRLEPVDDPDLYVEWFFNGTPLTTGTRVHTVNDFGFIVLEIDWLFPRDSGEYLCKATNKHGFDTTKATLKIRAKRDIILESQLPPGMSTDKLRDLDFPPSHPAPTEEVIQQPPRFITQIHSLENLVEGNSVHFDCKLTPINDPKLRVEWYHNGKPLISGHRFKTTHDFGFVALDILYIYPEDSGEYIARAVNDVGEDITKAIIKCKGKPSLIYQTQLPKEMEAGVQKIAEMEASWQRMEEIDDSSQEKIAPMFVLKLEPQDVLEGDWAKFSCRVVGYPRPRVIWILNGNTVINGSRYKLSYDGINHLDIPKSRQYDTGKIEVFARNTVGEAYARTTLTVRPRHDDYRVVLKNSPRPWYDYTVGQYQRERIDSELEKVFEEKLTPGGTEVQVWRTESASEEERVKIKEFMDMKKMEPEVNRYSTKVVYFDKKQAERTGRDESESQVNRMAKTYHHANVEPESSVHGREVHIQKQHQVQMEHKGDIDVTRHITTTETREKEHKGLSKERLVKGPVEKSKPPEFTKKIQPCRVYEGEKGVFECTYTATPTPIASWYRENFLIQNSRDFQIVTTENSSVLTIREVYMEDSGVFSVKIENRVGTAKSSANLVVEELRDNKSGVVPPSFSKTIQDTSADLGQLVRLDVRLTGSKPMDVYWLKNGSKIMPNITHKMLEDDDLYTLLILEAGEDDMGQYECVAINHTGEARCSGRVRVVKRSGAVPVPASPVDKDKPPKLVEPIKELTVKEGQPAVFRCKISGVTGNQVLWFKESSQIKQSRFFRMGVERDIFTLKISEAFPEDEGQYRCTATTSAGTVSTSASLHVLIPESLGSPPTLTPLTDLIVPEGSPTRFVTSLTGVPTPTIAWYREGQMIQPSRDFQMAQDNSSCSLVILQTYLEDEGIYSCKATNSSGQAETSARLVVESKKT